jgi:1,4-alpha-glucan branching enzyme
MPVGEMALSEPRRSERRHIEPAAPILPDPAMAAIVEARHGDPFAFLGMHKTETGLAVRAMLPDAQLMLVLESATGKVAAEGVRAHPDGLFIAEIRNRSEPFRYRLRVAKGGAAREFDDIYRFPPVLGDLDLYLLAEGNHFASYTKLGAHPIRHEGVEGVAFAVWAPNARSLSVVGDFNDWDGRRMPMRQRGATGFWELFVPALRPGHLYKYQLHGPDGQLLPLKADPHAERAERPPGTASIVADPSRHIWNDGAWMTERWRRNDREAPISIYEVHLGSWRRRYSENGRYLSYRELAGELVSHVAELGFTHIEMLPIMEYPFDGSWGYQPISLFAPTSRYGQPDDFRALVEACHQAGVGVLLDWVPGHFPNDPHGLGRFDGTALYEHADPRQGFHRDWNTLIYNYGRREVANFLLSNALYWLREFHIDGIRVDAVASMLYRDYSRPEGEWIPNAYGGRENLEAINFLRRVNELIYGEASGAVSVAEESTAWPMVSRPTYVGGLGFGYKWNLGWMHDTLSYMSTDPIFRKYRHNDLSFGLLYAFHENFILPLSHDEIVHGKGSLIGKMPGDEWKKFATLRALFGYMWAHPGKQLLFMGSEFGQWGEWSQERGLDWAAFDGQYHLGLRKLVGDLNAAYRELAPLWREDFSPAGFSWIDANDAFGNVISFLRFADQAPAVACVVNFSGEPHFDYRVGLPSAGRWREVINSDAAAYGGSGLGNMGAVQSAPEPWHGRPASAVLTVPPLGALWLVHDDAAGHPQDPPEESADLAGVADVLTEADAATVQMPPP